MQPGKITSHQLIVRPVLCVEKCSGARIIRIQLSGKKKPIILLQGQTRAEKFKSKDTEYSSQVDLDG